MPRKFVPHPETGLPVEEVVSHVAVDLAQLQAAVDTAAVDLETKTQSVEALTGQLTEAEAARVAAEAALEDAKSSVTSYQEIAPESGSDTGSAGSSSDVEAEAEVGTGEAEGTDEPDPAAETVGDDSEAVSVPVEAVPAEPVF